MKDAYDNFSSRNPWVWGGLSILAAFLFLAVLGGVFITGSLVETARWISRL